MITTCFFYFFSTRIHQICRPLRKTRSTFATCCLVASLFPLAHAENLPWQAALQQQSRTQQQRQQAIEDQLAPATPSVRLLAPTPWLSAEFPPETPCFALHQVALSGTRDMPHWLPLQRLANHGVGQCLGSNGINQLMALLQNRLVDHGYVTTRVLAPAQDLHSGVLQLTVVPGNIRNIVLTEDSNTYLTPFTALPAREGALLDLRDIEQGLENLQRLPTVETTVDIIPGEHAGESDLAIRWQQRKMWRVGLSLDDTGSRSTGQYQGGVTFYLDNPLSLSDMAYLSLGHDLQRGGEKGTRNLTGHYTVPFGYWGLSATYSNYDYHQEVVGASQNYTYQGTSQSVALQLSRVLHRSGNQKTSLNVDISSRESKNFINDTEVEVQRRHTSAWKAGLDHRHYIGASTLDVGISYQRGTRWFGAQPAPEELFDEATALSKILRLQSQFTLPFGLFEQRFRFSSQYQRQLAFTPLTPQDQFSLGSRWSVRGFSGERTLSADNGWFVRNELSWRTPLPNHELYLGLDYGEVGGRASTYLIGKHLAGSALGVRGSVQGINYDLFIAKPLSEPANFNADPFVTGFSVNWQY